MEGLFGQIRDRLSAHVPKPFALSGMTWRESAVLVPMYLWEGEVYMVFTRRNPSLRNHGGQISFPGGARDEADPTPLHTALRETHEELGLPPAQVEVLGQLDETPTITQFRIAPFVGAIPPRFPYQLSKDEIDELVEVPVRHLLRPENQRVEKRHVMGGEREIYFYDFGPHVIWGATARIVQNFFQLVGSVPAFQELVR